MTMLLKGNNTKYQKALAHQQNHVPGKNLTIFWKLIKDEDSMKCPRVFALLQTLTQTLTHSVLRGVLGGS